MSSGGAFGGILQSCRAQGSCWQDDAAFEDTFSPARAPVAADAGGYTTGVHVADESKSDAADSKEDLSRGTVVVQASRRSKPELLALEDDPPAGGLALSTEMPSSEHSGDAAGAAAPPTTDTSQTAGLKAKAPDRSVSFHPTETSIPVASTLESSSIRRWAGEELDISPTGTEHHLQISEVSSPGHALLLRQDSGPSVEVFDRLVPGTPVKLCGMRFPALNCMEGVVERRSEFGRSYTVRIEDLDETITLPITDFELDEGKASKKLSLMTGRSFRRPESSIGLGQSGRSRPLVAALSRTRSLVRALSRSATELNLGEALKRAPSLAAVKSSLSRPLLGAWLAEKKQRAKEQLLEMSIPFRRRVLESIGDLIKDRATLDPDMPPKVKTMLRSALEGGWNDVQTEIEESLDTNVHGYARTLSELEERSRLAPGPRARASLHWLLRMRRLVLFHYLPYNKSFFGKFKDPLYCFMTMLALIPPFGIRLLFFSLLLALLVWPWPPDEFQLINFILLFKGMQFFTSGVIGMLFGAMEYYYCYLAHPEGHGVHACIESHGPGTAEYVWTLLCDYLGSIALVWLAFLVLPMSKKFPRHGRTQFRWEEREDEYCFCLAGDLTRGGRLGTLLRYDVCCFFTSWAIVFVVNILSYQPEAAAQSHHSKVVAAKAAIFWCRVIYALLSLPFAFFIIPVLSMLLTHTVRTGFNENGACVQFAYPRPSSSSAADD
mmetsp:Transcript_18099/g.32822  ORF Transcript_18099/g.32822 Transcript_18099/m.32822 type:complete len:720 (+) Transcript_18099:62-2221(+)